MEYADKLKQVFQNMKVSFAMLKSNSVKNGQIQPQSESEKDSFDIRDCLLASWLKDVKLDVTLVPLTLGSLCKDIDKLIKKGENEVPQFI